MTHTSHSRTLHLVDLDHHVNPVVVVTPKIVSGTWERYLRASEFKTGDSVVVASSHRVARVAWFVIARNDVQLRTRRGLDGADLALLDELDVQHAARRFSRLVIGSGDHIFASVAVRARAAGLRVDVVARRGAISHELARVASCVVYVAAMEPLPAATFADRHPRRSIRVA